MFQGPIAVPNDSRSPHITGLFVKGDLHYHYDNFPRSPGDTLCTTKQSSYTNGKYDTIIWAGARFGSR